MSENVANTHLKELGKSDYEIANGHSDIRGWVVKNEFGKILGKVNDLIFDTKAKSVKYLILDLDGNELYMQVRKVLLPLDITEFDEVYKNVIYPGLMANELSSLPTYEKGNISDKVELFINNAFSNTPRPRTILNR